MSAINGMAVLYLLGIAASAVAFVLDRRSTR